jgi:hypothetical protein
MAHFAEVIDGKVVNVSVVLNEIILDEDGSESEDIGKDFMVSLFGGDRDRFVQCSYNGSFRGLYPGVGFAYDPSADVFVAPEVTDEAV